MAGSKKNQTTNRKQTTGSKNSSRASSTSKNTKSQKGTEPKKKLYNINETEENFYMTEIMLWILCAVMLIIELGNFGLCGFVNYMSNFFFGLFGVVEYVLPIGIAFTAFFLYVNEYKKRAVHKVILGFLLLLCAGMVAQITIGLEDFSIKDAYMDGFEDHLGGGVLFGGFAFLLNELVGQAGSWVVIISAVIIAIVLFAEISVIDLFRSMFSTEKREKQYDKGHEEGRWIRKQRRTDRKEIVKEDYPESQDEIFTERKKSSVLESISVLPSETDQGILPSTQPDKLPKNEEVHEITMDYEINLPGERMTMISGGDEKTAVPEAVETPKKRAPRKKSTNTKVEETKESNTTNILEMENKTAAAVKNVSAKEIGNSDANYQFPPLEMLSRGKSQGQTSEEAIRQNALKLQEVLKSFGVNVTMTNYSCGPSVTRYEMVPDQGVKVSKITGLADDIMMNLAAQSIRIEAPIPGKSAVGIEIPNGTRSGVGFRELIDTDKFIKHPSKIAFAVGKDIEGNVVVEDIAKMPHLLIAGATGSGKSVCTNTLIMSILYKARPDEVKLILIDPKQVELKVYNGIPHLMVPVVTDPKKAAGALNWAVAEMTKRYQLFSECNVRNIQGYNAKVKELEGAGDETNAHLKKMPQIVIIVDELADLMMVAKSEVEEAIVRLAQLARAAGIHLVIATQRPSVDVVTGLIKANVPSRIALSVSSGVDSRTIIDSVGAEKLLGNGDMLFYPTMYPKPLRVQGAYISDDEVVNVVEFLKAQNIAMEENEDLVNQFNAVASGDSSVSVGSSNAGDDRDDYFAQAGIFIIEKNKASIGMLQRMYKIGFNRAARIMDQLHTAGVVGPEEGTKPRQVLMTIEEFEEYLEENGINQF